MLDMRKIELRIVSDVDSYPVELPDNVGLLLSAKQGQPMRVLVALMPSMDGGSPNHVVVPIPVRLGREDELHVYHEGLLAAVFAEDRGIAVDPMTLIGPGSTRAKRRRR